MTITDFHPSHFGAIRPQWFEREFVKRVTPEYLAGLAAEPSKTLWIKGRPMACCGVLGGCELWAYIDAEIRPFRFTLYRAATKFLSDYGWLYANVSRVAEPCNWLEHLGFTRIERGTEQLRYERTP
jgi:hypothetical protein